MNEKIKYIATVGELRELIKDCDDSVLLLDTGSEELGLAGTVGSVAGEHEDSPDESCVMFMSSGYADQLNVMCDQWEGDGCQSTIQ